MSALALCPDGESDELRIRRGWEFRGMHWGNRRKNDSAALIECQ